MLHLRTIFRHKEYHLNHIFGFLLTKKTSLDNLNLSITHGHIDKAEQLLCQIDNPFLITDDYEVILKKTIPKKAVIIAKILVWSYKNCYPIVWLMSHLRLNIFSNGVEACDAFCQLYPKSQNIMCLPRSVFTAITSTQFRHSGAMFIGCFLPSHHMHAWVIENGKNTCRHDSLWINYTPISMMI